METFFLFKDHFFPIIIFDFIQFEYNNRISKKLTKLFVMKNIQLFLKKKMIFFGVFVDTNKV